MQGSFSFRIFFFWAFRSPTCRTCYGSCHDKTIRKRYDRIRKEAKNWTTESSIWQFCLRLSNRQTNPNNLQNYLDLFQISVVQIALSSTLSSILWPTSEMLQVTRLQAGNRRNFHYFSSSLISAQCFNGVGKADNTNKLEIRCKYLQGLLAGIV